MWKLSAGTLLNFLLGDFQSMWEVLATNEENRPRGNFAFGLLAMTLLELACRACHGNAQALQDFADALDAREPRYFWRLPKPFGGQIGGMTLPTVRGVAPEEQLLGALFDMVRNGQAHLYQQTFVQLTDGGFAVSLTGAPEGAFLEHADASAARQDHLGIDFDIGERVLVLKVRVDVLFCDLRHAIQKARLVERDLSIAHFQRKYDVSVDNLRASFATMNGTAK
jgi:hypothetical protein